MSRETDLLYPQTRLATAKPEQRAVAAAPNRLSAPMGLLVDHNRAIRFRFEGKEYLGLSGDTVASALIANGVWVFSRSFKYHRPRSAFTMAGQDANTLVQLKHEPNVLADRYPISEGLEVTAQNVNGSLEKDRDAVLGLLSRFMPVGFYYKAFYRPKGIWKYWERLIRRKSGLGWVRLDSPHGYYDKAYGFCDVAVIGAGPAGLAAALTAAQAGAEVLLVEENPLLGGSLSYARFDVKGKRGAMLRDELVQAVMGEIRIQVMTSAVCNGWFADNWLPVIQGNRLHKVRANEVILATGSLQQPAQFHNNDLPGIVLGSAAQRLIRLYGVRPGKRAVVLTANSDGYAVALDLLEAGIEVAAVVDMREQPTSCTLSAEVQSHKLRIIAGHMVWQALPEPGNRHVRGVVVEKITGRGQCASQGETIFCDLLCLSVGFTPTYQLALQAGARLNYDDADALFAITDLPAHLHLAGAVNGVYDLDTVLAEGHYCGATAARTLGLNVDVPDPPKDKTETGCNHPWTLFPHPKGKDFVDFDEDLQIADIVNATADGYADLELVKRYSTVGMGPSQGRHSALATARLVADATGRRVAEIGVTTARPPFTGETLGVLAGRSFEPERFTPMHHRHQEAGAQMMVAGLWWRPAFYGFRDRRDACIREEVLAVRNQVGLIDVSTLGGLEIRGPDAGEFLNRLYTFGYAKQPLGRVRYTLMTDEAGTIIDDGVACRLGARHFYVTATTSGVERVYRQMLWWNVQWRLDVDVTNVTAAFAAVNIAGPRSREVLARVCHDVDLSAQAFPYMGLHTGTVAGIPARIIRVGFVGELGYEIHVPASQGEALWDALMQSGQDLAIRPFGVEAQRLMRLEKGHIIVGQDSDGATFPHEVNMAWAISRKKPFFVGGRSIELRLQQPLKRKLIGFTIEDPAIPVPEESNLVLAGDAVLGYVTSAARSPILEKTIGMAFTTPDRTEPGTPIHIKLSDGRVVQGRVTTLPFYDPDNQRQTL